MVNPRPERPGVWRETGVLLREAWRLVRAGGSRLAALILVGQLVIVGAALPVIGWLYREALRASGLHGLDMGQLQIGRGFPLTIALVVLIIAIAFWLISMQFTLLVMLLRRPGLGWRGLLREAGRVARKLLRPRSAPLLFYLFLLLPLTGFGFMSTFTGGIAIPSFISGELAKSTPTSIGFAVFMLVLAVLNVRLALTVPVFVLTEGDRAARSSWRLTRGLRGWLPIVLAGGGVLAGASLLGVAMIIAAVVPTAVSDGVAPAASPLVAAYSLGAAQVLGIMLTGFATALVSSVLISAVLRRAELLPPGVRLVHSEEASTIPGEGSGPTAPSGAPRARHRTAWAVLAGSIATALVLGTLGIGSMQRLSDFPETLVLAHRGFSDGGVENTISGLDAAKAAGADLVEMDVMQTKDGEFVAMHDATLGRLADRPDAVKDLTFDELTAITVHDMHGHEDLIPSFADYATHADRIGMPLLVEIKLSGAETPDHVDRLVAELESLGLLERNIYHSLDAPSVERLKQLRPDLTVGYTMAFAAVDVPDTPADFIVVEEWSATEKMQDAAVRAGLGFMTWTVNDEPGMREHLRRGSDGVITDHPDIALRLREEMQQETGLADVLVDAMTRFVTVV